MSDQSVYDAVGGTPWFVGLIDRFYDAVAADVLLRPMYPDDLTESREHMVKFLVQYWGGPTTYSEERGHPRLRMRHAPFVITSAERDAWLKHMVSAVSAGDLNSELEQKVVNYFEMAATHMINTG
jgi:hemoglobin